MKIKKIGHCCLVINVGNKRVLTDPGAFTIEGQEQEKNIDLIVITHEHSDHLHVDSVKKIIENNPEVKIVTNSSVGKILGEAGIPHEVLEDGGTGEFAGVYLEAHGTDHAEIYGAYGQVMNTGYFIGKDLFYPGDAFTNPGKPVDILAVPIAGPWMKIKEAIEYAKLVKPRVVFPVHDAILSNFATFVAKMFGGFVSEMGAQFKELELGKEEEI